MRQALRCSVRFELDRMFLRRSDWVSSGQKAHGVITVFVAISSLISETLLDYVGRNDGDKGPALRDSPRRPLYLSTRPHQFQEQARLNMGDHNNTVSHALIWIGLRSVLSLDLGLFFLDRDPDRSTTYFFFWSPLLSLACSWN